MNRIVIEEYQESKPLELSTDELSYLLLNHKNQVEVIPFKHKFILKANSYIGYISLKNTIIYLKPKIPDENLLFIISYLFDLVHFDKEINLQSDEIDSILDLMVILFIEWVKKLIKKGLYRKYVHKTEKIPAIKGKILTSKNLFYFDKIYCSFDELSYSSTENMIIKATLLFLLNLNISNVFKEEAKRLIKLLSEVKTTELSNQIFNQCCYSRLNQNYTKIIDLSYHIFNNHSINNSMDNCVFQSFTLNMNTIFEQFIRKILQNTLPHRNINKIKIDNWALGEKQHLIPSIIPDIIIDKRLVIDTKYYSEVLINNSKYHSSNLYQTLTYMNSLDSDGMLIYPETNTLHDEICFINDRKLYIKTINLGVNRKSLLSETQKLIDSIENLLLPGEILLYT